MFGISKKAFTALLVGSIMAVMVGSILLIISYTVVGAVLTATPGTGALGTGTALNTSLTSNINNIIINCNRFKNFYNTNRISICSRNKSKSILEC